MNQKFKLVLLITEPFFTLQSQSKRVANPHPSFILRNINLFRISELRIKILLNTKTDPNYAT